MIHKFSSFAGLFEEAGKRNLSTCPLGSNPHGIHLPVPPLSIKYISLGDCADSLNPKMVGEKLDVFFDTSGHCTNETTNNIKLVILDRIQRRIYRVKSKVS